MGVKNIILLSISSLLIGCTATPPEPQENHTPKQGGTSSEEPLWFKVENEISDRDVMQILSKTPQPLSKIASVGLFKNYLAERYNDKKFIKPKISNTVANQPVDFDAVIEEEEISVPQPKKLYHKKVGNMFYAKYELKNRDALAHLRSRNAEIKKKVDTLKNDAIYSEDPYFQYKYFQQIESLLAKLYKNLGLMNVLTESEEDFEEEISYINRNLYTFYKIKNNLNFRIHKSNDQNLVKFIKLSLIEKNLNMTLDENDYTLYLDISLNRVGEGLGDGEEGLYVITVDIIDRKGNIYNSITFDLSSRFEQSHEKTMYNLYKEIYNRLNQADFFGGKIIP